MLSAITFPITPEGIPVRGGAGKMPVPLGLNIGFEMGWGGAKAIQEAKIFL